MCLYRKQIQEDMAEYKLGPAARSESNHVTLNAFAEQENSELTPDAVEAVLGNMHANISPTTKVTVTSGGR